LKIWVARSDGDMAGRTRDSERQRGMNAELFGARLSAELSRHYLSSVRKSWFARKLRRHKIRGMLAPFLPSNLLSENTYKTAISPGDVNGVRRSVSR
jgi:hypothetical protein